MILRRTTEIDQQMDEYRMNEPTIRLATSNDVSRLATLRLALRSRPGQDTETEQAFLLRCRTWMAEALKRPEWRCWVAFSEDVLKGALWMQLIEKIPNPTSEGERIGYITNFFIDESARGKGLGTRMLQEALDCCRKESVHSVILWPTDRSRTLYQRHGFTVREDLFELILNIDPRRSV